MIGDVQGNHMQIQARAPGELRVMSELLRRSERPCHRKRQVARRIASVSSLTKRSHVDIRTARFLGHESFPLRHTWLTKGVIGCSQDPLLFTRGCHAYARRWQAVAEFLNSASAVRDYVQENE